jgi:hypothetical protein
MAMPDDPPSVSDLLSLWQHFEDQASQDKDRMIASVTLLFGFISAFLGSAIIELAPGKDGPRPLVSGALAILGFLAALWARHLVGVFANHAGRKYAKADHLCPRFKEIFPVFKEVHNVRINTAQEPNSSRFEKVGRIFDRFAFISEIFAAILALIFIASVIAGVGKVSWPLQLRDIGGLAG